MKSCICGRLYRKETPNATVEYAFSGSLCCIRQYETIDGFRYCLTTFSVRDYSHLHFPHDEYKYLISKLYALLSTECRLNMGELDGNDVSIEQLPLHEFKIEFGGQRLDIGPVTAFGLVNTSPFENTNILSPNNKHYLCDVKWDVCTCAMCPIFKRLVDYESDSSIGKTMNMIFN